MKQPFKPSYKFYRGCYYIARSILGIFYWIRVNGKENIPAGAAMVCSNHSSVMDPIFIALAFGIDYYLHFIAKVELFTVPVLSFFVIKLGAISVNREMMDPGTMKNTLTYFKKGEKVAIFPEGTRSSEVNSIAAKSGAVKIADRAGVPLVPVYVPRRKLIFSKLCMVIGKPYYIEKQDGKRSLDDYAELANDLMRKIEELNPAAQAVCGPQIRNSEL